MTFTIAEPLPYTLLSLSEYAIIMGINPVHFMGATATADGVFPIHGGGGANSCNDLWHRYSWQWADSVSHYDLAETIQQTEYDIARELGYWPAPMWIAQEVKQYPQYHRPDSYRVGGRNVRGMMNSVKTNFGKIISGGRRHADWLATATTAGGTLTYSDEDLDGFAETATVEIPTTLTNETEIKIYFTDTEGAQEWEIRPAVSKVIDTGIFTAVFRSWLFIDPDLLSAYPTVDDPTPIDISTTANFVTSVDVYHEYNDPTDNSAELYWEPTPRGTILDIGYCSYCGGAGCEACTHIIQDGCIHVRDANRGFVVPTPGTYDSTNAQWNQTAFTVNRDPDFVKLWYYCGDLSQEYLSGRHYWTLPRQWARLIAYMATARLERPFCSCGNLQALANEMRADLAAVSATDRQAQSYRIDPVYVLQCPFGTRKGEVMAWMQVLRTRDRIIGGGVA